MAHHVALLDANVVYPYALRQILLDVAERGGFEPRWSGHVMEEVGRHLKADRGLTDAEWERLASTMHHAFPSALVTGYEPQIPASLDFVRDVDDAHVVAAAMTSRCDRIVTENTRDFDVPALAGKGLRVGTSDEFLTDVLIDRETRNNVYAGLLGMRDSMRERPSIRSLLDTLWGRSRLYGLCQRINVDVTRNLGITADEIDDRAIRARMRQIEQGIGL
jgi:predicted nucleic acid-binding protein